MTARVAENVTMEFLVLDESEGTLVDTGMRLPLRRTESHPCSHFALRVGHSAAAHQHGFRWK